MSSDRTSCRLSDCPASRRPGDCPAETDTPSDIRRLGGEARHWQGNPTIKGIKGQEAPTRIQAHSETKLTQRQGLSSRTLDPMCIPPCTCLVCQLQAIHIWS